MELFVYFGVVFAAGDARGVPEFKERNHPITVERPVEGFVGQAF
jgi:hypothetical protein